MCIAKKNISFGNTTSRSRKIVVKFCNAFFILLHYYVEKLDEKCEITFCFEMYNRLIDEVEGENAGKRFIERYYNYTSVEPLLYDRCKTL